MGRIKINFAYNVLLNVANVIFPLITAPYISRVLDPTDIGLFNFAVTFSGYFALMASLGIPTYGVREIAKHKDSNNLQQVFDEIFTISLISTVVFTSFYLLCMLFVQQLRESLVFFFLSGVILYLKPFSIEWLYQGLEKFGYITIRSIIIKTLSVILMFCFVQNKSDLMAYLIIFVFCQCANQIWNAALLKRVGIKIRLTTKNLKRHISPILILFISSLAVSIYTILDTIMIGFVSQYADVAYYTHANNIIKLLVSLVTSLAIVTMPRIAQLSERQDWTVISEIFKKSVLFISFLVFPLCVSILCIAPLFIPLFYGDAFIGSILPLQILSPLIILIGFSNLAGMQILVPLGKDKLFLVSVLFGTFTNLLLNFIFIPKYGAIGASLSSVASETIVLIFMLCFIFSQTHVKFNGLPDMLKGLVGSLTLIPIFIISNTVLTGWWAILLFTLAGSLIYFAIEAILKNGAMFTFIDNVKFILKRKEV